MRSYRSSCIGIKKALIIFFLCAICTLSLFVFPSISFAAVSGSPDDGCPPGSSYDDGGGPGAEPFCRKPVNADGSCDPGSTSRGIGPLRYCELNAVKPDASLIRASCDSMSNFFFHFFTCTGRAIGALISGLFIGVAVWTLVTVGHLFNWLIDNTIVQFGSEVYDKVKPGIETAWKAFRDIANILIIGVFTFIAISMILGLETFGTKKMVAKVLMIAVLINFSLLFTKIIIDASNFTAKIFYDAMNLQTPGISNKAVVGTGVGASAAQRAGAVGVAGKFIDYMGVAGVDDVTDAQRKLADQFDNGFVALLHGLVAGTLLLAAALVLLYGAFLMVARAVLMLILLMTSALAFASYLIPRLSEGEFGWKAWWSSLLKNAVFAPILMMFLWATLTVAYEMKKAGQQNIEFYEVERYRRTSSAFSIYIMALIGVSVASRKVRGGLGWHIVLGIGLSALYEVIMKFTITFSTNASLPPVLGVWIPNLLYAGLAVYLIKKAPK